MNHLRLKQAALGICLLMGITHAAYSETVKKEYVYKGDESAKTICLAIAKNNVKSLNRALKNRKFSRLDNKVHERYQCNGKDLLSFAQDMQAPLVAGYLSPKFGYESEYKSIASADR